MAQVFGGAATIDQTLQLLHLLADPARSEATLADLRAALDAADKRIEAANLAEAKAAKILNDAESEAAQVRADADAMLQAAKHEAALAQSAKAQVDTERSRFAAEQGMREESLAATAGAQSAEADRLDSLAAKLSERESQVAVREDNLAKREKALETAERANALLRETMNAKLAALQRAING